MAELGPEGERRRLRPRLVFGGPVVAVENAHDRVGVVDAGRDEEDAGEIERLVEFGGDPPRLADLDVAAPLGSQGIQAGHRQPRDDAEVGVPLEVVPHVHSETDVVRPPLLLASADDELRRAALVRERVVHPLKITQLVDARQVGLQGRKIERCAHPRLQASLDDARIDPGNALDRHGVDVRRPGKRGPDACETLFELVVGNGVAGQGVLVRPRRRLPEHQNVLCLRVVGARHRPQVGDDREVGVLDLILDVLSCQHARDLRRDVGKRAQRLRRQERRAHVDREHHVGPHGARDVHRQVAHQPAVTQEAPVHLERSHHPRDAHAGPQGIGQMAVIEDHHLAAPQVRGHGPERDRQAVEVAHARGLKSDRFEGEGDLLARDQPARQEQAPVLETHLQIDQVAGVVLLPAVAHVAARRTVVEQIVPVEIQEGAAHLRRGQARGVQPADDRSHAGAGDEVDRDPQLLEDLEDADVRDAARASAAQGEADPGPVGPDAG